MKSVKKKEEGQGETFIDSFAALLCIDTSSTNLEELISNHAHGQFVLCG